MYTEEDFCSDHMPDFRLPVAFAMGIPVTPYDEGYKIQNFRNRGISWDEIRERLPHMLDRISQEEAEEVTEKERLRWEGMGVESRSSEERGPQGAGEQRGDGKDGEDGEDEDMGDGEQTDRKGNKDEAIRGKAGKGGEGQEPEAQDEDPAEGFHTRVGSPPGSEDENEEDGEGEDTDGDEFVDVDDEFMAVDDDEFEATDEFVDADGNKLVDTDDEFIDAEEEEEEVEDGESQDEASEGGDNEDDEAEEPALPTGPKGKPKEAKTGPGGNPADEADLHEAPLQARGPIDLCFLPVQVGMAFKLGP